MKKFEKLLSLEAGAIVKSLIGRNTKQITCKLLQPFTLNKALTEITDFNYYSAYALDNKNQIVQIDFTATKDKEYEGSYILYIDDGWYDEFESMNSVELMEIQDKFNLTSKQMRLED